MKNLEYKGYNGTIEYSKEDGLFYGKVIGIQSLISYEGETGPGLESDFKEAINGYLEDCETEGIKPEKAFKGSFNVRVSPELHKSIALWAKENGETLNSVVSQSLQFYLHSTGLIEKGATVPDNFFEKDIKKYKASIKEGSSKSTAIKI